MNRFPLARIAQAIPQRTARAEKLLVADGVKSNYFPPAFCSWEAGPSYNLRQGYRRGR